MTDLPSVETLSPPPTNAELAWWDQHCRRERWWGFGKRFVLGVSSSSAYFAIRYVVFVHRVGRSDLMIMTLIAGAVIALVPRPNTELFDAMTTAIRDRRVRQALLSPSHE